MIEEKDKKIQENNEENSENATQGGVFFEKSEKEEDSQTEENGILTKDEDAKPLTEKASNAHIEKVEKEAENDNTSKRTEEEVFKSKFPNTELGEVKKDALFSLFRKGKDENISLSDVYSEYLEFLSSVKESEFIKNVMQKATDRVYVGSLYDEGKPDESYFTKEEVACMTPEQVHLHYDKIRQSQEKW